MNSFGVQTQPNRISLKKKKKIPLSANWQQRQALDIIFFIWKDLFNFFKKKEYFL